MNQLFEDKWVFLKVLKCAQNVLFSFKYHQLPTVLFMPFILAVQLGLQLLPTMTSTWPDMSSATMRCQWRASPWASHCTDTKSSVKTLRPVVFLGPGPKQKQILPCSPLMSQYFSVLPLPCPNFSLKQAPLHPLTIHKKHLLSLWPVLKPIPTKIAVPKDFQPSGDHSSSLSTLLYTQGSWSRVSIFLKSCIPLPDHYFILLNNKPCLV